jgi:hypothetical protein
MPILTTLRRRKTWPFNAMSETLDRMGKPRDAIGWESKARTLYRAIEVKNPGSLDTATNDAASLLHFGSLEAKLGLRAAAAKDLGEARDVLQRQVTQSPKNRPIQDLYQQAARLAASAKQRPDGETRDSNPVPPIL